jgi:hypothetical protein
MLEESVSEKDLPALMKDVTTTLQNLEVVSGQLLCFLDVQLLRTLKELDRDIERAKSNLVMLTG